MSVVAGEVTFAGIVHFCPHFTTTRLTLACFLSTTGAVPRSLIDALRHVERPTKRRKVVKSSPYSLAQEIGVSSAGLPLGYIPLARLSLHMVSIEWHYGAQ